MGSPSVQGVTTCIKFVNAVLFGDEAVAKRILQNDSPREQKALGRKVANFEEGKWKSACRDIVKRGNLAKVGTTIT